MSNPASSTTHPAASTAGQAIPASSHLTPHPAASAPSSDQVPTLSTFYCADEPDESSPSMPGSRDLTLIVAATAKQLGIGKGGALPWPHLKGEMGFFARVTKRVRPTAETGDEQSERKVNAVIMGRKTWDSIPSHLRPLKGRMNFVISRSLPPSTTPQQVDGPYVVGSLTSAMEEIASNKSVHVQEAFVIGGSSLYKAALEVPEGRRVLMTKVLKEYDCDVAFPVDLDGNGAGTMGWRRRTADEWTQWTGEHGKNTQGDEQGVRYEFCLYEREGGR